MDYEEIAGPQFVDLASFAAGNGDHDDDGADKFFDVVESDDVLPDEENVPLSAQSGSQKGTTPGMGAFRFVRSASLQPTSSTTRPKREPFVSMAEAVRKYQVATPKRFKSRRSRSSPPEDSGSKRRWSPQLTVAHTPNLVTKHRARPVRALSRERLESITVCEMKKMCNFKANPVNYKILAAKPKLPNAERRPVTATQPFQLTVPKQAAKSGDPEPYVFHARPVPQAILKSPSGTKWREAAPVTVPQPLNFHIDERLRARQMKRAAEELETEPVETKPKRSTVKALQPTLPIKTVTCPEPFSFEERDKHMKLRREEREREREQEERRAREFRAQLLPNFDQVLLPNVQAAPVTQPAPFKLEGHQRGEARKADWAMMLEHLEGLQKRDREFTANPCKVIYQKPFVPATGLSPIVTPQEVMLHTEVRAKERANFDEELREREAEYEIRRQQHLKEQEMREKEEILQMRKEMVTKAQPVPQYKDFILEKSSKPSTKPQSPNFSARFKK